MGKSNLNQDELLKKVANHIDEKLSKKDKKIAGVKGDLFDILTLGDDSKLREDFGESIKENLEDKIKKEEKKKEPNIIYIRNLEKIISDLDDRIQNNRKHNKVGDKYLDLDNKFDEDVIKGLVNQIINEAKKNDKIDNELYIKITDQKNYAEFLRDMLVKKYGSLSYDKQKNNLMKIIFQLNEKLGINSPGTEVSAATPGTAVSAATPGTAVPAATPGAAVPAATPGASVPAATPGTAVPAATPGTAVPAATPGTAVPAATTGTAVLAATPGTAVPAATPGTAVPPATPGDTAPEIVDTEKEKLIEENKQLKEEIKNLKKEIEEIKEILKSLKEEKNQKEDKEIIEPAERDIENMDPAYRKKLKEKLLKMKDGDVIILRKGGKIIKLQKINNYGWKAIHNEVKEFDDFIENDVQAKKDSRVSKENLRKFFNFEDEIIPPIPTPTPDPVIEGQDLELSAVISDMGTDVHRERVSLETEEDLREEYKKTSRWNVGKKGYLFLSRGAKRKRLIKEKMAKLKGKAFSLDNDLDEKTENASDRHEIELLNNLEKINKENTVALENPQINQLCKDYLEGKISESAFKTTFNDLVDKDVNIQTVLKDAKLPEKQKITHIGTNILEKLKLQKASADIMSKVNTEFEAYINDKQDSHIKNINTLIETYIRNFQHNPKFLTDYQEFLSNKDPSKLKLFFKNNEAVMKMQIKNLKVKIDVLTAGKSAYQIDNKDRQNNRAYKLGNKLDKLPRWVQTGGFVGISLVTGLLTGGLGTVASAARVTGVSAGSVGAMNAIKKWTHYTKEQNTHEKNIVTDNANEKAKLDKRHDIALNGKRYSWKKYKANRQLALYNDSTQQNIEISNTITDAITDICSEVRKLTPQEENYLKKNLIQGKVRLDYYRDIGHNFLASNDKEKIEKDMKRLEKSIILGATKLGISLVDIASLKATDDKGEDVTYANIRGNLKGSYDKSLRSFRSDRIMLAAKYGLGTAVASAGMSLYMQHLMGTGVYSHKPIPGTTAGMGATEHFDLGKHNLLDTGTANNIHNTAQNIGSNSNIHTGSIIDVHYGAGTDATGVLPGKLTNVDYTAKLLEVQRNINGLPGLNASQKLDLMRHISSKPWEAGRTTNLTHSGNFTNDFLHGIRCAEGVEQIAKGLSDAGYTQGIKISYDSGYDIVGGGLHNVTERVFNADFMLNNPGTGNSRYERLVLPVPLFFNTFKDRVLGKNKSEDPNKPKEPPVKPPENPEDPTKPLDKPKTPEDKKPVSRAIDPTKDPDNYYKDDVGKKKLKGKGNIRTRGQKIDKIDISDFGKEYPGIGALQSPKDSANGVLKSIILDPKFIKSLNEEDANMITKMREQGESNDDIINYIEKIIQVQRQETKDKEHERAYKVCLDQCYDNIPKYLRKLLGDDLSAKFNDLPNKNRVHLIGEYDYLAIAGSRSSGVFRSESGDIYISKEAIQQFEKADPVGHRQDGTEFPRVYREIKHLLTHELLHSMSVINYNDNNENNEKNMDAIGTRRLGLLNINYKSLNYSGRGINEGTTENLTLEILDERYTAEKCIDYIAPRKSYRKERQIIQKVIDIDKTNLNRKDFQKTMLLRKYEDKNEIEGITPLVELMRKFNGGKEINNSPRPYYYQIITYLLDYVNDNEKFKENYGIEFTDINFILDFIEKKDISIIKNHFGKNLKVLFYDKTLLNTEQTDFNQTILDGYSGQKK